MTVGHISLNLIAGILSSAKRIMGDDAIKIANEVEGLKVTPVGEIIITQSSDRIIKKLVKSYEGELQGEIIVDIDVRMNVKSNGTKE